MSKCRCQRGFTLIEVVVAFAIFALSIGAIYEISRDAVRRSAQADVRSRAWVVAESTLARIRLQSPPWPAQLSGVSEDGLVWQVQTSKRIVAVPPDSPWQAFDVLVHVRLSATSPNEILLRSVEVAPSP